ncbi:MAG: phosphoribosylglycinamide formyltransferase [Lachnospiraceae bacterium]|nr:phosphoribosylglycinamide formyltransferase [Lachnospiraceae bacterium]
MLNLIVLVSGGGTNLQAIIDSIESGYNDNTRIIKVISNNKNAYALERAKNHKINAECISPKDFHDREDFNKALIGSIDKAFSDNSADNSCLIVLAGYLVVIPSQMIEKYENRIINIHPSLIPSFCGKGFYGLKVHEAALSRGAKITGATVHFVDSGTDTGPIILQKAVEIQNDDTPETIQRRVMEQAEWKILPEAIKLISEGRVIVKNHRAVITK